MRCASQVLPWYVSKVHASHSPFVASERGGGHLHYHLRLPSACLLHTMVPFYELVNAIVPRLAQHHESHLVCIEQSYERALHLRSHTKAEIMRKIASARMSRRTDELMKYASVKHKHVFNCQATIARSTRTSCRLKRFKTNKANNKMNYHEDFFFKK